MDLLEWKKLNSKISFVETKKKFFKEYYYNIKYNCPGGRIILSHPDGDEFRIADAIDVRHQRHRLYNYGGSWRANKEQINKINVPQLVSFNAVRKQYIDQIKMRVEEPYITFYTATEDLLFKIASQHLKAWDADIVSISRPTNDYVKTLLDAGSIVAKSDNGYRYKFICKDGLCTNKDSICAYLENLEDQVKVSRAVKNMLEKDNKFIWGAWFYANDIQLANMLNIIEPNFITNIHEVVVA